MIKEEEPLFCYNITIRRAAGLVGVITMVLSVGTLVRATYGIRAFEVKGPSLCEPVKRSLHPSCKQVLETAWVVALMVLVDSALVFGSSFLLFCGVLKEVAWLMVPYMMWIKMTLSIHCVLCVFLATTYQMEEIGPEILLNVILIVVHGFCAYIVRQYDDELMKKIFNRSEAKAAP